MISAIITSYKEPRTIGKAITALLQTKEIDEVIVTAPDKETIAVAKEYPVKIIQDEGRGKPAALNKAMKGAKGKYLILTDGDVTTKPGTAHKLTEHFKDPRVGAVTGRVRATNSAKTMYGYWARRLTNAFHNLRQTNQKKGVPLHASGYYYAVKKELLREIPENILADDAFISEMILAQGKKIVYEPEAEVYVKYPTTLPDWIRQKKRTAAKAYQLKKYFRTSKKKQFVEEVWVGMQEVREVNSPREFGWLLLLYGLKTYLWARTFLDKRLWERNFKQVWERVETTK